jgi:hypothetical protein
MRAFALLMLCPIIAFAEKPERNEKPKPYESSENQYRVAFPKDPTVTSKKLATAAGPLPVHTARAEASKDLVLSVTVTTYPESFLDVTPSKLLDGVRDGLKGADGTVKADKEITFGDGKHPARDVTVEAGKTTIRAKLILVDRRLYQVMLTGSKDKVAAAEDEFLKSFELMK